MVNSGRVGDGDGDGSCFPHILEGMYSDFGIKIFLHFFFFGGGI